MASQREIDRTIQAYIDGELSASERVILEKKLHDSPETRALLARQQTCAAELFETLREHRLEHDLVPYVMSHLPEMDHRVQDVQVANRRAKNPTPFRRRIMQFVPLYAVFIIVGLGYVLTQNWPGAPIPPESIGIVTLSQGNVQRIQYESLETESAPLATPCFVNDAFLTGDSSHMLLTLQDQTRVRVAPETRFQVMEDRTVHLERGRMLLNVSQGQRLFRVLTEHGTVTVYGTTFEVSSDSRGTTVAVAEGEVTLTHRANQNIFATLGPGEMGLLPSSGNHIETSMIDAWTRIAWASTLLPDERVETSFLEGIRLDEHETIIAGRSVFFAPTVDKQGNPTRVVSVTLSWMPGKAEASWCSYDVLVTMDGVTPLFQGRIPGDVFSDPSRNTITLRNNGDTTTRCHLITLDVYPNYDTGMEEVQFHKEFEVVLSSKEKGIL